MPAKNAGAPADALGENPLRVVVRGILRDRRNLAAAAVSLMMISMTASAAVTVSYSTQSRIDHVLSTLFPVVWEAGPDSSGNDYVSSFTVSPNGTYFTITLKPLPEGNVTWGNLTSIKNAGTVNRTITVNATSVQNYTKIMTYRIAFFRWSDGAHLGTLDLKASANPTITLGGLGASERWFTRVYIQLDDGAGATDIPASVSLGLTVT
ncbi:MAG: hypothetical protein ACT4PT_04570 [Methanobacteriota archaeon]